jgi:ABC-2 type transport system permease protein
MLSKIAGFEVRYQLFSPMFIAVFSIFFLMFFALISSDGSALFRAGATNINAPIVFSMIMIISSLFGGFIPAVFLSSGVLRDRTYKSEELFFTRPVRETDFILGRFIGGFIATALCFSAVPLALVVGSLMPWLDPELIGPTNPGFILYDFVVLGLVNMWMMGAILFTVANMTRNMMLVWAAFIGLIVLYVITKIISNGDPEMARLMAYVDPFGSTAHREISRYWTTFEENRQVVPLEGTYLINRALWFGIGLAALAVNVATFRFRKSNAKVSNKRKKAAPIAPTRNAIADINLLRVTPNLGSASTRQQFFARLVFEIKGVVFNFAFWVILILGLLNTVPGFFFGNSMAGTASYPVTRTMMDIVTGGFAIVPFVVIAFYAAELMWRERSVGFSDIVDATPTPNWIFITTKYLAMSLVLVALAAVAIASAMITQSAMEFENIEVDQYAIRGLVELVLPFLLMAALAIFLQVVFNNRWIGMIAFLVYYGLTQVMGLIGLDHFLYRFGQSPPIPYSDMNDYGHFLGINLSFTLYWGFWALMMLVVSYQLWNRGALTPIAARIGGMVRNATPTTSGLMAAALIGAGLSGGWIFYNTNILNSYVSGPDVRAGQADYERTYGHLAALAQPTVTDTDFNVDIYPHQRRYDARGSYVLANKTDEAIDTLWISYAPGTTINDHSLEGASLASADDRARMFSFALETPMQPGESRNFDFSVSRLNPGFRNSGNVSSVVANGTFFNHGESMPEVGVNENLYLLDPAQRRHQGLDPLQRSYQLEDSDHWHENAFSNDDYVTFRTIVSTSGDQIAVAPGYLEREWTEDGRNYFEYVMDQPSLFFFSWQSADYQVAEREVDGVLYQVFYDEAHAWNVERMLESAEDSVNYFSEQFGPYQYRQMRIQEFPVYSVFAQAFPNTIPFSEGIGFIADLNDPAGVDYVYMVTAHEAAHQWWAHQLAPANVQGATMLVETFAEYSSLMLLRQRYGEDHMRRYLMRELEGYLDGRGAEAFEEQPLYRVEDQQYIHYRKGALIMYALQDYVGEATVNRAMRRLIDDFAYATEPYATTLDFLRILREEVGPDYEGLVHDFFERIILFDLSVTDASASQRADGRWDLVIDIEAHKFEADGGGEQTEEPIDYMIDIGVFTRDLDASLEGSDHVLYLQKHRINETTMRIELIVDEEPHTVGIDPYIKLIDRESDDNLAQVSVASSERLEGETDTP